MGYLDNGYLNTNYAQGVDDDIGATTNKKLLFINTSSGELTEVKNDAAVYAASFRTPNYELTSALLETVAAPISVFTGALDDAKYVSTNSGGYLDSSFLSALTLNDFAEMQITAPAVNNILYYTGSAWANSATLVVLEGLSVYQAYSGSTKAALLLNNAGTLGTIAASGDGTLLNATNSSTFSFGLKQAPAQTSSITWTLPVDAGFAGAVLTDNGSGALTWSAGGSAGGVWYSPATASEQLDGKLVYVSAENEVSVLSSLTSSNYAVGITSSYNTDPTNPNKVKVLSDDSLFSQNLSSVLKNAVPVAVGDRIYWDGSSFTGDIPNASGERVWQVGVVAEAGITGKVHIQVQLIKVNAA